MNTARFALLSALITAIALLLAVAVPAQAEPVSDAAAATTAAASDVVVVAEDQTQAISAEPAPASTEPIENATASTAEAVPVEETAAAVESSGAAGATIESDRVVSSAGAVADSAERATPRSVPSTSEVGATVAQASKATVGATAGNVSKLAGEVSRDSAERATSLVNRAAPPAVADSPVPPALARLVDGVHGTDRLRGLSQIVGTVVAPLHELLDTGSPAQAVPPSERIARAGTQPAQGVSSMGESLRPTLSWPLGGVLSREREGGAELAGGNLPTSRDSVLAKLTMPGDLDLADALATLESAGDAASGERSGGRAPLDTPVPLPGSSGGANGAPGSFFVPFAALFALLALTAPAARRRLEEAPAFRPSTPFVCGLERPG